MKISVSVSEAAGLYYSPAAVITIVCEGSEEIYNAAVLSPGT